MNEQSDASDFVLAFTALAISANFNARNKGFYSLMDSLKDHPRFAEIETIWKMSRVGLIHSEASEVLEGLRKPQRDDHLPQRSMEVCELADIVIRILDYAGEYKLPVAEVVIEKMHYNASRPYMHGKQA